MLRFHSFAAAAGFAKNLHTTQDSHRSNVN